MFDSREKTMVIWEKLPGARLTNSYSRSGGLYRDLYNGFEEDVLDVCNTAERNLKEWEKIYGLKKENESLYITSYKGYDTIIAVPETISTPKPSFKPSLLTLI